MKTSFSLSGIAMSNIAVVIIFTLIFLTGALMAQNATVSRDYWHPNKSQLAVFVKFSDSLNADSALAELKRLQLQPANLDDLMAYHVSTYVAAPANKIVALGSKYDGLTGYNYIPYSDADEKQFVCLRHNEFMWDTSFVFMAFRDKSQFSFPYLDCLYEASPELKNDTASDNKKDFERLFINDQYKVVMWSTYHPSVNASHQTWMNEFVVWNITYRGQIIEISNELSYQSIENPKIIGDNLVFKAIDRSCKHGFYTVVPLGSGAAYNVMPN